MGKEMERTSSYELYGTDKYQPTWDSVYSEPSDVYAGGGAEWLERNENWFAGRKTNDQEQNDELAFEDDLGDAYPRGV